MGNEPGTGNGWSRRLASVATRLPEYPTSTRLKYALLAALGLVVVVRLLTLPAVFQDGSIVLTSNDPYYYRYWVDALNASGLVPWEFPRRVALGEPLLVSVLWLASVPFGGDRWASGFVLGWYPVVSALVTGYLVYAIGTRVSDDPRVGLASVVLLAVTPAHAYRTTLGFADHHPFDYLWLAVTVYVLVVLLGRDAVDRRGNSPSRESGERGVRFDRRTWLAAGVLGVAIAGQVLAWEAGPLLVVPAGIAIAVGSLFFVRGDREESALPGESALLPIVAGVGVGAGLVLLAHFALGWHTWVVTASVLLLFLGSVGVYVLTTAIRRIGLSWPALLVVEVVAFGGGVALAWSVVPDLAIGFERGVAFLTTDTGIGEMSSLGDAYGPVFGPLIILGLAPFLALGGLPLSVWQSVRNRDPAWLVVVVYVVYFAGLTVVQRRFGGELAPVLAVLAGFGFVAFLSWLDLVRRPNFLRAGSTDGGRPEPPIAVPDRTRLALLGGLSAVVVSTGTLFTGLINRRTAIERRAFRAAKWMRTYAEERDLTYPENYVLSEWGRNRMYNYVVNGRSESYAYARQHYEDFLFTSNSVDWYERFRGRVGFVVTREFETVDRVHPFRMLARLHEAFGSATEEAPGVGHYRAVYASADGEYKVFTLVPGATIAGTIDGSDGVDEAIEVRTDVSIEGAAFEYVRRAEPDDDGAISVTVAHPGEYRVGDRRVSVSESAVLDGETIRVDGN
jgi:dolichyl-diphosphooligosaccharide--protein glycosyltransferase